MSRSHVTSLQAHAVAAFTLIVGCVVAFVPSLGTDKQNLIAAGSALIALGFEIANGIHAHGAKPPAARPKASSTSVTGKNAGK